MGRVPARIKPLLGIKLSSTEWFFTSPLPYETLPRSALIGWSLTAPHPSLPPPPTPPPPKKKLLLVAVSSVFLFCNQFLFSSIVFTQVFLFFSTQTADESNENLALILKFIYFPRPILCNILPRVGPQSARQLSVHV